MARVRQLRSYSRDCFAPSQETTGEHHAYDLVYLQNVDLGKFATRASVFVPSLRAQALQLSTSHSLQQQGTTTTMPPEKRYNDETHVEITKLRCAAHILKSQGTATHADAKGRPACH